MSTETGSFIYSYMFKFVVILKLKTVRILPFVVYALLGCLQGLAQVVSGGDLGMARDQYERGKYYEAIELLNHTLKADSANDEAYYLRGLSFLALGNSDSAVNDFSEAIDHREVLDNTAARYYLYRAVARTNRRDYSNAEKDFTEAIHLNPSEPEIYFESSRLKFLTMGDKQAAITDLDWAVQLNPRKPEYYHKRAEYKAYQVKHNHFPRSILESAIRDVTFAISLDPGRYDYIEFRATLYKEVGDPMLAIEDYTLMIGMKPGDHTPYSERGIIRMQYDDYPNAIDDFTQAIGKDPEDEKNYRYRALCKYNSSDYRGAYADYSSAIMLLNKKYKNMPDEKTIRRILADTYIKRGVSATMLGNNFNACMDFSNANDLGSSKGYNYMRKYCGF